LCICIAIDVRAKDDNGDPIIAQKMVYRVSLREVFNLAIKPTDQGGFEGARDSLGNVVMSETSMWRRWPNWIVCMNNRFKAMCVCDKCGVPTEVHESLSLKRSKILTKLKKDVERMPTSRAKTGLVARLKKYESEIMENGKTKFDRASKMVDAMTCPPIEINGESLHKFACAIGDCEVCKVKYEPIEFEAECVKNIKYNLYDSYHNCSWHMDSAIEEYINDKGKTKHRCSKCHNMSEEETQKWLKQKKPATVTKRKLKTKYSQPLCEFVKVGGVYHNVIKIYRLHRFHQIFLGTRVALKMIREFNRSMISTSLMLQSDYSEKYQMEPDGQFQSQYFDKQQSLSMEDHATTYWNTK